jgi:hypothetical protein
MLDPPSGWEAIVQESAVSTSHLLRVRRGGDLIARVTLEQLREGVAAAVYKVGDEVLAREGGSWRELAVHLREAEAMPPNHAPPVTVTKHPANAAEGAVALYPPTLVGTLGLVFSPALGAFLARRNWEALGDPAAARRERLWFLTSLVCVTGVVGTTLLASAWLETAFHVGFLVVVVAWFLGHRRQIRHVRLARGPTHPARSARVPIILACIVTAAVFVVLTRAAFQRAERIVQDMGLEMPTPH